LKILIIIAFYQIIDISCCQAEISSSIRFGDCSFANAPKYYKYDDDLAFFLENIK